MTVAMPAVRCRRVQYGSGSSKTPCKQNVLGELTNLVQPYNSRGWLLDGRAIFLQHPAKRLGRPRPQRLRQHPTFAFLWRQ